MACAPLSVLIQVPVLHMLSLDQFARNAPHSSGFLLCLTLFCYMLTTLPAYCGKENNYLYLRDIQCHKRRIFFFLPSELLLLFNSENTKFIFSPRFVRLAHSDLVEMLDNIILLSAIQFVNNHQRKIVEPVLLQWIFIRQYLQRTLLEKCTENITQQYLQGTLPTTSTRQHGHREKLLLADVQILMRKFRS